MEKFLCETAVFSGSGTISALRDFGAKRLFLVSDPYFVENGTADRVIRASGCGTSEVFADVKPDPTVELTAEGTAKLRSFGPDLVVALGGGSAMDCAKAMTYFARCGAKLVAIPTTSGSGSEMTDFAILTHGKVKHPLVDPALRPCAAILDSDLLTELPRSLIADCGFDVLTHALEAYVAKGAGTFSDLYAKEAFSSAYASLPASYAGQQEVRLKIHLASAMAGIAFTHAGLGLCHAMAHSLGGMFHVPHGRLNAILLPAIVGCNAEAAGKKYADIARAAGIGGSAQTIAVRNLRGGLIRLRKELHLPETLAQAGVPVRTLWNQSASLVAATLADPCCASNPVQVDDFMVRRILEEVVGRG